MVQFCKLQHQMLNVVALEPHHILVKVGEVFIIKFCNIIIISDERAKKIKFNQGCCGGPRSESLKSQP